MVFIQKKIIWLSNKIGKIFLKTALETTYVNIANAKVKVGGRKEMDKREKAEETVNVKNSKLCT